MPSTSRAWQASAAVPYPVPQPASSTRFFPGQPRGKSVARLMLIEQVGFHLIGDDALSSELSHGASFYLRGLQRRIHRHPAR